MAHQHQKYVWPDHGRIVSTGLRESLERQRMEDVTLIAREGDDIKAHRFVLSMFSPYFKRMFESLPDKNVVVALPNIPRNILEYIIQYIYVGVVDVPRDANQDFIRYAEELQIKVTPFVVEPPVGSADEEVNDELWKLKI